MFKRLRIGTKLLAVFLLVGLIPLAGIGVFSYLQFQRNMREQVMMTHAAVATVTKGQIEDWFKETRKDAGVLSITGDICQSLEVLRDAGWDRNDEQWVARRQQVVEVFADRVLREYGYGAMFLADPAGRVVFSTDSQIQEQDLSTRDYIRGALAGRITASELFYSEIIQDDCVVVASRVLGKGFRAADAQVPVNREVVGVLCLLVHGSALEAFVQAGLDQIGDTADAYLVSADGTLMTNTRLGELSRDATLAKTLGTHAADVLMAPIASGDESFAYEGQYLGPSGNSVLGSLSVVELGDHYAGLVMEVDASEAFAAVNAMRNVMLLTASIVALIVTAVGLILSRSISKPLVTASAMLKDIAQGEGDLTQRLTATTADEVGELAQWFNAFVERIREIVRHVAELAGTVADGSQNLSAAADQTGNATSQVAEAINQVASGASDQSQAATNSSISMAGLAMSVDAIVKGSHTQRETAVETTRAMQMMSAALEDAQASTAAVSALMKATTGAAVGGRDAVLRTIEGMGRIDNTSKEVAAKIEGLGRRSGEIGNIVEVIDGIAEQTNLLALNAAIEAARAGEYGRGFAVVAEEVRRLAENAQTSTGQIADLIKAIDVGIQESVKAMSEGTKEISHGVALADETRTALDNILEHVEATSKETDNLVASAGQVDSTQKTIQSAIESINALIEENTKSAQEISVQTGRVVSLIESIAAVSEETAASAEEVSAAAEEQTASVEEIVASIKTMAQASDELRSLVGQFKT